MDVRMSGNRDVVVRTALYGDKIDQTVWNMMHSRKSMAASAPTFVANNSGAGFRNAAGASVVGQGAQDNDGMSFFEREKARLIEEIGTGFEDLLGSANTLNRKLEEVFGVGKEFQTVADLWGKFDSLIREQKPSEPSVNTGDLGSSASPNTEGLKQSTGVPGTGGRHFAQEN